MKNVDIPFFAVRTRKDFYTENVKPNLSRSEVEIGGKLRDDIVNIKLIFNLIIMKLKFVMKQKRMLIG